MSRISPPLFPQFKIPTPLASKDWHPIPFTDELSVKTREGIKTVTRRPLRQKVPARFQDLTVDIAPVTDGTRWAFSRIEGTRKEAWPPDPQPGFKCPYGVRGDFLWIREAAKLRSISGDHVPGQWTEFDLHYRASGLSGGGIRDFKHADVQHRGLPMPYKILGNYQPPMFMPRWASRTSLIVKDVRIERIQDITEEDVLAEGVGCHKCKGRGYYAPTLADAFSQPMRTVVCQDCLKQAALSGVHAKHGDHVRTNLLALFEHRWGQIYGPHSWGLNIWVWRVEYELVEAL